MEPTEVIKKPIITEKSMRNVGRNQYTFEVAKEATKRDVARAVEELFDVETYRVRIFNKRGKSPGRRERRAIVTINPKQKIDIFEKEE